MITHLPRYSYYFSSDAAARAQIASFSDDDEQKQTAGASLSSSQGDIFELLRPQVVYILMGLRRELSFALLSREQDRAAAACAAIVRVLCGSDVEKKSTPLLSESVSSDKDSGFDLLVMSGLLEGPERDVYSLVRAIFNSVIRCYLDLEMRDRAAQTFFLACGRGCVPCISTCNYLMEVLFGCDELECVGDVYREIKRSQVVRPDLKTCRFMMRALCSREKFSEALGFSNEMIQEGIGAPDASELVTGLCDHGRPYSAYLVLIKSVSILGISMTTYAYHSVISGFCKMGKLCEAELVLEDMVKQGVPPEACTYALLIGGYCSLGVSTYASLIGGCCSSGNNISRVLSLLDQMDTRGIKANRGIRDSILPCFSELGKNYEVLEFFKNYKRSGEVGEILDKVLYNIEIDARCKLGKMEEAVEMFQEMKGCGLVPDKIHYDTLISGYCRRGEIDDAWKTFRCMIDVGLKPDIMSYSILASEFANGGYVEETLRVFHHMLAHGVEPDSVTRANVIEGFCRGLSKPNISHV